MKDSDDALELLHSRLPELLWQLEKLSAFSEATMFSKGLVESSLKKNAKTYITDIKLDLQAIKAEDSIICAQFLAKRILKKISLLVLLCRRQKTVSKSAQSIRTFQMKSISTRQDWQLTLDAEIKTLSIQENALTSQLSLFTRDKDEQAYLAMLAELGEVRKQLTLVKEVRENSMA